MGNAVTAPVKWPLLLPALVLLTGLCALPLVMLLAESFGLPAATLDNYRRFITDGGQLRVMIYTLRLSLTVTAMCLLLGYPTAWLMTRLRGRALSAALAMVVAPYLTSLLVRTYAWVILLSNDGIVNSLLIRSGFIDSPAKLLYNDLGVHIGMVHIMLPFMILPLYSAMRRIDGRLVSASYSLGAGPLTTFVRVYLPQSWPGVRSAVTLVFVLCLGFFVTPAALGGPDNLTFSGLIEAQVTQALDFGQAATAAIILLAATLTILRTAKSQGSQVRRQRTAIDLPRLRQWLWQHGRDRPAHAPLLAPAIVRLIVALVLLFLIAPSLIMVPMSFNDSAFLQFPPAGWSLRWYRNFLSDELWLSAIGFSFSVGVATAVLAALCGTAAACALPRGEGGLVRIVTAAMLSPLIIPSIVLGIGIYRIFAMTGLLGTWTGLVLAHGVAAMGYVFLIVRASLEGVDPSLARAAASLGAAPLIVFHRIVLPLIMPGIAAGTLFAFMHSFDELVITRFIAGFRLQTLPLKMWEGIRHTVDPTVAAVSSLLLLLTMIALILSRIASESQGSSRTSPRSA